MIAGATAVLLLRQAARIQPGETVFVQAAAGGVGSLAVQLAKHFGASTVIAGASTQLKRERALSLGADHAIDYTAPDWPERLRELLPNGVDVILEMAGGPTLEAGLRALAPFGRTVVYGSASNETRTLSQAAMDQWLSDPALGHSIIAFNLGAVFGAKPQVAGEAIGTIIELVMKGVVKPQVGHILPLKRAAEAHELIRAPRLGRQDRAGPVAQTRPDHGGGARVVQLRAGR